MPHLWCLGVFVPRCIFRANGGRCICLAKVTDAVSLVNSNRLMSDEADLESSVNPEAGSPTRAAAFKAFSSRQPRRLISTPESVRPHCQHPTGLRFFF